MMHLTTAELLILSRLCVTARDFPQRARNRIRMDYGLVVSKHGLTGFSYEQQHLGTVSPKGQLPLLDSIFSIPGYEYAARNFLDKIAYTWMRYGTGPEYLYKNNLVVYPRVGFKPWVLTRTSASVNNTSMQTSILGPNFCAPFLMSPAATPGVVGYIPPDRELGLLRRAYEGNMLHIPTLYAKMSIEEAGQAASEGQVRF